MHRPVCGCLRQNPEIMPVSANACKSAGYDQPFLEDVRVQQTKSDAPTYRQRMCGNSRCNGGHPYVEQVLLAIQGVSVPASTGRQGMRCCAQVLREGSLAPLQDLQGHDRRARNRCSFRHAHVRPRVDEPAYIRARFPGDSSADSCTHSRAVCIYRCAYRAAYSRAHVYLGTTTTSAIASHCISYSDAFGYADGVTDHNCTIYR